MTPHVQECRRISISLISSHEQGSLVLTDVGAFKGVRAPLALPRRGHAEHSGSAAFPALGRPRCCGAAEDRCLPQTARTPLNHFAREDAGCD